MSRSYEDSYELHRLFIGILDSEKVRVAVRRNKFRFPKGRLSVPLGTCSLEPPRVCHEEVNLFLAGPCDHRRGDGPQRPTVAWVGPATSESGAHFKAAGRSVGADERTAQMRKCS